MAHFEFDEYVDIAVGTEIVAQHRAEEGQAPDVMPPAELRKLFPGRSECAHA